MSICPRQVRFEHPIPSFHLPIPPKTEKELAIEKATQYFLMAIKDKKMIKHIKAHVGERTFTCLRSHKGNPSPLVEYLYPGDEEKQKLRIKTLIANLSIYIPKKP
jgi:hypothetical protein